MSRIGDALESRDLITRVLSARDRRRMVLRITSRGEDVVRQLLPKMFVPVREMFSSCTPTEQSEMVKLLRRVELQ